jgi:hypothetical protein
LPKSANERHLLQNMSLNRVEDFFIADVGFCARSIMHSMIANIIFDS